MQTIGPYAILEVLARGGQGVVYRARGADGEVVALKLLLAQRAESLQARKRFAVEVRALERLEHPHVVGVLASGEHEGAPWLALPYVEGASLEERLRLGPLPIDEALRVAQQLAQALSYVHAQGVLHRDLKPANVLLRGDEALLTDFGLAREVDGSLTRITATGVFLGTPGYWPPEQARGELDALGPRSDVYGLGAILYACLTACPPVQAESFQEFLQTVRFRSTPPPARLRPEVPAWLSELCMRCLEEDPDERPASADEVARALAAGDPASARPSAGGEAAGSAAGGGARGWVALAGVGALLIGGVAWALTRPAPAESAPSPVTRPSRPRDASPPVEAPASARPPSPFVLPVQLDQTSLVGCFQGERLLVASAAELQEWDGRGSNALRRVALPPGRGLRRAYGLLALGPERVLIGGEGFELYEWTSRAGFRALGLPDVQALERLGDRAAYGLDSGELGVFALGATLLEEPPATLDLGERDTAEVLDLAWLSPTRLLAVTGGRTARDLSPSARAVQESMGALYLLDYDPAAGALTTLQREGVLGAQNVAVSGGGAPQVLVGTSTGHLFLWRLGAGAGGGERLVAAGESYRAPGAPLKVRDVLFVRETLALGALVVRAGVDPAAWAYAEGVLVYDLADAQPRVFTVPGVAPRGLLFEPEGEQVIVLGDHGRARVVALEAILEGAQPLDR